MKEPEGNLPEKLNRKRLKKHRVLRYYDPVHMFIVYVGFKIRKRKRFVRMQFGLEPYQIEIDRSAAARTWYIDERTVLIELHEKNSPGYFTGIACHEAAHAVQHLLCRIGQPETETGFKDESTAWFAGWIGRCMHDAAVKLGALRCKA